MSISAIGGNANTYNPAALQGQGLSAARRSAPAATTAGRSDGPAAAGPDGSATAGLQAAVQRSQPDARGALLADLNAAATYRQANSGAGETNATAPSSVTAGGTEAQMKLQSARLAQAYSANGAASGTTLSVAV